MFAYFTSTIGKNIKILFHSKFTINVKENCSVEYTFISESNLKIAKLIRPPGMTQGINVQIILLIKYENLPSLQVSGRHHYMVDRRLPRDRPRRGMDKSIWNLLRKNDRGLRPYFPSTGMCDATIWWKRKHFIQKCLLGSNFQFAMTSNAPSSVRQENQMLTSVQCQANWGDIHLERLKWGACEKWPCKTCFS